MSEEHRQDTEPDALSSQEPKTLGTALTNRNWEMYRSLGTNFSSLITWHGNHCTLPMGQNTEQMMMGEEAQVVQLLPEAAMYF